MLKQIFRRLGLLGLLIVLLSWLAQPTTVPNTSAAQPTEPPVGFVTGRGCTTTKLQDFASYTSPDLLPGVTPQQSTALFNWGAPVRVNDVTTNVQNDPSLVVAGNGDLLAVWRDTRSGGGNIFFSRSTDQGQTWSANVQVNVIANGAHPEAAPKLAVLDTAATTMMVVWVDLQRGHPDIIVSRSVNGGATWAGQTLVNDDTGTAEQYAPTIAFDTTGQVTVVWEDYRNGTPTLLFAQSTDLGRSFTTNNRVLTSTVAAENPSLAFASNNDGYCAWCEGLTTTAAYQIVVARLPATTTTWTTGVVVNDSTAPAENPNLLVGLNNTLYVAWEDQRNGDDDIFFARSTDQGQTWTTNVQVSDAPTGSDQYIPYLAQDSNGQLYAIWVDSRSGSPQIYVAASNDNGDTWSTSQAVAPVTGNTPQDNPQIGVDSSANVYAIWDDARSGDLDVLAARSGPVSIQVRTWVPLLIR